MTDGAEVAERLAETLGHRFTRSELLLEALTSKLAREGAGP